MTTLSIVFIGVAWIEATEAVASVKKKIKKNKIKIKKPRVFNLENNTSQYYWLVVLNRVFHVLFFGNLMLNLFH